MSESYLPRMLAYTLPEAQAAADAWGFNCGPGALTAILGCTPEDIRPHLWNFQDKGYINPTLMLSILRALSIPVLHGEPVDARGMAFPSFGLARVQWGGRCCGQGLPALAASRHTHWIAVAHRFSGLGSWETLIFDINAIASGGWISLEEWRTGLVPFLLNQCEPKADGTCPETTAEKER